MNNSYWKNPKNILPKPETDCYCKVSTLYKILYFTSNGCWYESYSEQRYDTDDILQYIEISELNNILQNGCEKCKNYELEYDDKDD